MEHRHPLPLDKQSLPVLPAPAHARPGARGHGPGRGRLIAALALGFAGLVLAAGIAHGEIQAGYRDFFFGDNTSSPTSRQLESKLWWNDGSWWAMMVDPATDTWRVYELDWSTQQWNKTGTELHPQKSTRSDVLWDGQKLYVASRSSLAPAELRRFSYDGSRRRYSLDAGFPVTVNDRPSNTIVLDKDSAGRLWITYAADSKIWVNHSQGGDTAWGTPFVLPFAEANGTPEDVSFALHFGGNRIGVLWSNHLALKFYFAVHQDGDPDDAWSLEVAEGDLLGADDHMNLKADTSGRVYAAVKSDGDVDSAVVALLVRETDGGWSTHAFGSRLDDHTVPIVLVDEENQRLHVFAVSPGGTLGGGTVYTKSAPLDDIHFDAGKGEVFIRNGLDPRVHDPTSTKQNLNGTTDLVVLASDNTTKHYLHNSIDLPSGVVPTPVPAQTLYLAEGYTGTGFGTFILLQNPNAAPADVTLTYMLEGGGLVTRNVSVPANARYTVAAQDPGQVGPDKAFSTRIDSTRPIIAERAMYWPNGEGTAGGHVATAITQPFFTWYLAEGYTGAGFGTFILLQNPNAAPAEVDVTYMLEGGGVVERQVVVPGNARITIAAQDPGQVGPGVAFSTKLVSNVPVIAERAMYFGNEGHATGGLTAPGKTWYLAEGYTGGGAGTFILIQNPSAIAANVTLRYMLQGGGVVERGVTVPANARQTVAAQDAGQVGPDVAFSAKLTSDEPIIVERAMYWPNGPDSVGGHVTTGVRAPASTWYLAEGYTGSGFGTFILVQNPNPSAAEVAVTYMLEGGVTATGNVTVPANARQTIVTQDAGELGPDKAFSTQLVSNVPIIVERSMYFANGGHNATGVTLP